MKLDLGSPVSSVSDPDLSGVSDNEPAKKDGKQKSAKPDEPVKPADGSQSEGRSNFSLSVSGALSVGNVT